MSTGTAIGNGISPVFLRPKGAQTPLLLDSYTALAAFSTRKLRNAQTLCCKLRRDSDNAELDFGFVGQNLDVAAIASFLGAATGYVKTWYDQSGNTNNLTQNTNAEQPLYVASGQNSKPGIDFDGIIQTFDASGLSATTFTYFYCGDVGAGTDAQWSVDNGTYVNVVNAPTTRYTFRTGGVTTTINFATSPTTVIGTLSRVGTAHNGWANGVMATDGPKAGNGVAFAPVIIGARGTADYFDGRIYEMIIYNSDQSANRVGIETNINQYWSVF